ncbi:MAG TPA: hypothetical protein VGN08_06380 [Solirubrobacteraceae bacterium]|jgi:photosystem II stability/assembly factor-like uncharacterized protein
MAERVRVFAVTGDDVVAFSLAARESDVVLGGVGARCVAVDPRDPDRVYVGTFDGGVHTTEDGGATWRQDEQGLSDRRVMSVAVSPSHQEGGVSVVYAGTEPSNLYRSEDAGRSWRPLPALRELPSVPSWSFPPRPGSHHVRTIALHHSDPAWLAVGIELGGVMRSRDGGASWLDRNPQAPRDAHQLLTHPLAPTRLYEAAGDGVARSEDLGESWRRLDDALDRHYAWAQALDAADPDLWYVAVSRSPSAAHGRGDAQAHLFRSRGDGFTPIDGWGEAPELRGMPYALASLPEQPEHLVAALSGGTLLLTPDAGESWTRLPTRLRHVTDLAIANA